MNSSLGIPIFQYSQALRGPPEAQGRAGEVSGTKIWMCEEKARALSVLTGKGVFLRGWVHSGQVISQGGHSGHRPGLDRRRTVPDCGAVVVLEALA